MQHGKNVSLIFENGLVTTSITNLFTKIWLKSYLCQLLATNWLVIVNIFTALHGMQMRSS